MDDVENDMMAIVGGDGGSNDGDIGNDSSGSCGDVWCTRR